MRRKSGPNHDPRLPAGLIYGLAIFALGFLLGTLRELVLAPVFGRTLIVWIEAPLILIAAWLVVGRSSAASRCRPRRRRGL